MDWKICNCCVVLLLGIITSDRGYAHASSPSRPHESILFRCSRQCGCPGNLTLCLQEVCFKSCLRPYSTPLPATEPPPITSGGCTERKEMTKICSDKCLELKKSAKKSCWKKCMAGACKVTTVSPTEAGDMQTLSKCFKSCPKKKGPARRKCLIRCKSQCRANAASADTPARKSEGLQKRCAKKCSHKKVKKFRKNCVRKCKIQDFCRTAESADEDDGDTEEKRKRCRTLCLKGSTKNKMNLLTCITFCQTHNSTTTEKTPVTTAASSTKASTTSKGTIRLIPCWKKCSGKNGKQKKRCVRKCRRRRRRRPSTQTTTQPSATGPFTTKPVTATKAGTPKKCAKQCSKRKRGKPRKKCIKKCRRMSKTESPTEPAEETKASEGGKTSTVQTSTQRTERTTKKTPSISPISYNMTYWPPATSPPITLNATEYNVFTIPQAETSCKPQCSSDLVPKTMKEKRKAIDKLQPSCWECIKDHCDDHDRMSNSCFFEAITTSCKDVCPYVAACEYCFE